MPKNLEAEKKVSHVKTSVYDLFSASKARKTYTNIGVSLLLIITFLIFALVPTIQTIDKVTDKISIYEELNPKLSGEIDAIRVLSNQKDSEYKNEIEFAEKVFQDSSDFTVVYHNIDMRAKKFQVQIIDISFNYPDESLPQQDTITNPPTSSVYQISISYQTSKIENAIGFISSLEGFKEFPIPSRIQSSQISDAEANAKINPQSTATSTVPISGSVSLIVYLDQS